MPATFANGATPVAATCWTASSGVGAFNFARNLSRSISACFLVMAPSPLLGAISTVAPEDLQRAVLLDDVLVAAEDPRPTLAVFPRLHLRMLNTCLHSQASSQRVKVTLRSEHYSSPMISAICWMQTAAKKPKLIFPG